MKLWIILYQHRFGTDSWIVRHPTKPLEDEIITRFKLDFEPQKEEFIEVYEAIIHEFNAPEDCTCGQPFNNAEIPPSGVCPECAARD
jgi:hypothetical protein